MSDILKLRLTKKMFIALNSEYDTEKTNDKIKENQEQILAQEFNKGFEEGVNSVLLKYETEYSEKLLTRIEYFQNIISSIDKQLILQNNEFEHLVITLSTMIAEKIIKREIDKESIISANLKEAVKRVLGANNLIIKVNPSDYNEVITDGKSLLLEDSFSKVQFEEVDRIERGGCFIETEIGNVDARISSQFSEVKKNLESPLKE
jgi:flagellar assembly protein FliH